MKWGIFSGKWPPCAVTLICLLFSLASPAAGQLQLVSFLPAHGAVGVDTLATLEFTFSAPLDTTVRLGEDKDFYLAVQMFPSDSLGDPGQILISDDLKTVRAIDVPLRPNTEYMLLLLAGRSQSGEPLDHPYVFVFTTGTSLPTATVSGHLTRAGGDPSGAVIGLFSQAPFGDTGDEPLAGAIVVSSTGEFTAEFIPAGDYYPLAFGDWDQDGEFDVLGEGVGIYDANGDGIADRLQVTTGAAITGIDFDLALPVPGTARKKFPAAQQYARTIFADAAHTALMGAQLDLDGKTAAWNYVFYSAAQDSVLPIAAIGDYLLGPIGMPPDPNGPPLRLPILANWIDSDVAVDSAEALGGQGFRVEHPDAGIISQLVHQAAFAVAGKARAKPAASLPESRRTGSLWRRVFPAAFPLQADFAVAASDSAAAWVLSYWSPQDQAFLQIPLDAETGSWLHMPGPKGMPTTARANLNPADSAAQVWAADAALVLLGSLQASLSPAGRTSMWVFTYYSTALDSFQAVYTSESTVLSRAPIDWQPPSKTPLPAGWIDSDSAMAIAEASGGRAYRQTRPDTWISATLSRGFFGGQPDSAVWKIDYVVSNAPPLTFNIDAVTGRLYSSPGFQFTARHRLQEVLQTAQTWAADAVLTLLGVAGEINPDGTAPVWACVFYSPAMDASRTFFAGASGPITSEAPLITPPSTLTLPTAWIDSDEAMAVAEANGGSAYRANHPAARLMASVARNMLGYYGRTSQATWKFIYSAPATPHLIIYIDAETAALIPASDPILTKARYNLEAAEFAARALGSDARLTYVMNNAGDLSAAGEAESWLFVFYAPSHSDFRSFQIMSGQPVFVWTFDGGMGSMDALPAGWVDSDAAVATAEANGGSSFRSSFADATVRGLLSRQIPSDTWQAAADSAQWLFNYISAQADTHLVLRVDGATGDPINPATGVGEGNGASPVPVRFALHQNYPNPFNPETSIPFDLPEPAEVTITIYNLLARRVRILVRVTLPPGRHFVRWDGKDASGVPVPGGLYFYELKAGTFSDVKKLLLLK